MDELIKYIQELCERVAQEDANASEIAQSLGNVRELVFQSLLVNPANDEWLNEVTVNQNATDDDVNHIKLQLSNPLELEALEKIFGPYNKMGGRSKSPSQAMFGIQAQSDTHTATLMAAIRQNTTDEITIRRDIRLV
jgi:hypothetical protein